jgi:hypothetical protein
MSRGAWSVGRGLFHAARPTPNEKCKMKKCKMGEPWSVGRGLFHAARLKMKNAQ